MKRVLSTFVVASLFIGLQSMAFAAQVRDATSKALGSYGQTGSTQWAAPMAFVPPAPVASPSEQQSANRVFSYETRGQAASRDAVGQKANLPTANRAAVPQRARRFSYSPSLTVPQATQRQTTIGQRNLRAADSKARGQY